MASIAIDRHYLTPMFEPGALAIVGASEREGSIGKILVRNLIDSGYKGKLYAVNPRQKSVFGLPAYDSVEAVPQRLDLAVIATPAETVPGIVESCGRAGTRSAVVLSAGFSETGPRGEKLDRALRDNARHYGVRVIGPNCLGIMRPEIGLNATFARGHALPGSLGLVSQSGALCTAMLDWARPNGIGFSSVVSLGASSDVDFGEILDYLAYDPRTEHILMYIEGIHDARRFVSALRAAARVKPVIALKVGRHVAGSRAARSHTGALVGADDVFDAAIRRAGVVRVDTIGQLVAAALALSAHVSPRGNRLAIVTNGGGPGVMAADRAADLGIPLAELSPAPVAALKQALPPTWSHGNPIDLIGDADPARYRAAVAACLADPEVDGVLAILTPQAMTDPMQAAEQVIAAARESTKPLLACWMGEEQVAGARRLLHDAHIATFRTPESAVDMFAHVSSYYRNQRMLMQTPGPRAFAAAPDLQGARSIVETALAERRRVLSEMESKALLAAFGIPIARTVLTRSANEAMLAAEQFGFPVAMKIDSPDIPHKTDVGGVRLNLSDTQATRAAYAEIVEEAKRRRPEARIAGVIVEPMVLRPNGRELMVGVLRDRVFGPAITFGSGGIAVEVNADRAVALPPLNEFLVADLIGSTRAAKLLGSFRRMPPVHREALEGVLLRVSEMVCELPAIQEVDINPLLADESGVVAVDARIVVDDPGPMADRYEHMAIHPYPAQLEFAWELPDGGRVTIRPIRPEDAEIEQAFVRELSPQSRYLRFMDTLRELTPAMLARFTQIDYSREMAFIAVLRERGGEQAPGVEREIGVCRYVTNPDGDSCEFALVVADGWQRRGLGRRLMSALIEVARNRGLKWMIGHVLAQNAAMLALVGQLGFESDPSSDDPGTRRVTLALRGR
jgi:acetyltransferase